MYLKTLTFFIIYLVSSGGSCDSQPFKYEDNSRLVVEAYLVNESMVPMPNQQAQINTTSDDFQLTIKQVVSDVNGKIFISIPKGNNPMILSFPNKDIVVSTYYSEIIMKGNPNWMGFLNKSYYNFGTIIIKDKI